MSNLEHRWDLRALFNHDEEAEKFLEVLLKQAQDFEKKNKDKLKTIKNISRVIKSYEELLEGVARVMTYAFLKFASQSSCSDFYAACELKCNEIQAYLLFFEIEFCTLPLEIQQEHLKKSQKYAYYLQKLVDQKKYQLSLIEEKILLKLSPLGAEAFSRLFDEFFSNLKIPFKKDEKSEEEILALLHHKNRDIRKKAQKAFTQKLQENQMLLTYIFNMIRKDLQIKTSLRHYEKKESFRHLSNDITQKSVDSLVDIINQNMYLVSSYYKHKAEILGYELKDYDRYAPIQTKVQSISYKEGLEMVLSCFKDFSPLFFQIASRAIKEGWVDSHPRSGKRGGAFSHGAVSNAHPYVLLNFTGNRRDVFTIAHEFGHMVHQELSKKQGYLNQDTPLTTAETASVFAEMLLFDSLKQKLPKQELLEIYASKLEDIFSTAFRQIVMTNFERRIHEEEGELKTEELNAIWQEENQKMFGTSVKLTKNYALWWSYIPHFIHSPFYCYAYSYGQLLVLALFGLYQRSDKKKFIKIYTDFLSRGGSQSPRDLILSFGFDVEDTAFWEIGIEEIRKMLEEFKGLL